MLPQLELFENISKFHAAQKEEEPLTVDTMLDMVCRRFARPIKPVSFRIPGGAAVLPSTPLVMGVLGMVAGCERVVLASPPRADGSVTPEFVYIAHEVGAKSILLTGGT